MTQNNKSNKGCCMHGYDRSRGNGEVAGGDDDQRGAALIGERVWVAVNVNGHEWPMELELK